MDPITVALYPAPIGLLSLSVTAQGALARIQLWEQKAPVGIPTWVAAERCFNSDRAVVPALPETCQQLDAYFNRELTLFTVPIVPQGSVFEQQVWQVLTRIPYGSTRSYQQIAVQCGHPKAARAVGQAVHRNPILIFIPCHRVIRSDGQLGGFACGVGIKRFLLELEGVHLP